MNQKTDEQAKPESAILAALHRVWAAIGYVQATDRNDFHKYNYVGEGALLKALRPAMVEAGLMPIPCVKSVSETDAHGNVTVMVEYTLTHRDGEVWPEKIMAVGVGNDRHKNGAIGDKGVYKALTGANKYFLFKLFQIATGDDPEVKSAHDEGADKAAEPVKPDVNASLAISAPIEGDWRDKLEAALAKCADIPAVNLLAKANEAPGISYAKLYPDKVDKLKALFRDKRAQLSQAPLGDPFPADNNDQ